MPNAGYSGTPLPKKIGIKSGQRLCLVDPPEDFETTLGELPPDLEWVSSSIKQIDVVVLFVRESVRLQNQFATLASRLNPTGMLWVAWPKKASKVPTDLTEDRIRDLGLALGLVDVKVCAIDSVWSGLKFVYRLKDRPQ